MELVDATVFLPLVIVAATQMVKMAVPKLPAWVTIAVAFLLGIVVALVDTAIGIKDISIANGILVALTAIGITVVASKAGGGARGDEPQ